MSNLRYNPLLATATPRWQVYHQTYHESHLIDWPQADYTLPVPDSWGYQTGSAEASGGWNTDLPVSEVKVYLTPTAAWDTTSISILDTSATEVGHLDITSWTVGVPEVFTIPVTLGANDLSAAQIYVNNTSVTLTRIVANSPSGNVDKPLFRFFM